MYACLVVEVTVLDYVLAKVHVLVFTMRYLVEYVQLQ